MKNILIIHPNLELGGAEKVLINLLDKIDYSEYKVTLLLIYKKGIYIEDLNENVNIKYLYEFNKFKFKIIQSIYARVISFLYKNNPNILLKFILKQEYDIEIAFLEGESTRLISEKKSKTSKKIAWVHCDFIEYSEEKININRKYYKNINKIVCVSNESKKSFNRIYPEYEDKTITIYNLMDKENILKLSKEKMKIQYKQNTIVAVGRLVKAKRFDLLIEAHKKLNDEGIENNLIIIGEGEERSNLEELINTLRLNNTVYLLGFIKNPYPYIKNSDIFCITSDYEGFSLVGAEALILGKPIISTKCAGLKELLDNGKYGVLVECNDIFEIKEQLKNMLNSEKNKLLYKNKSLERAKIFNDDVIIRKIYDVFEN
ncbi:MAG: hypothetical protein NSGCLCUN01_01038 [uncultured Clostridium sp.]